MEIKDLNKSKVVVPQNHRTSSRVTWIRGTCLAVALCVIVKGVQRIMNSMADSVECNATPEYYKYARWWSASASYCLGEMLLKQANPIPETLASARKYFIEATEQWIMPAREKLTNPCLYPVIPDQEEIKKLTSLIFTPGWGGIIPWEADCK